VAITYTFARTGSSTPDFIVAAQFDATTEELADRINATLSRFSSRMPGSTRTARLFSSGACGGDNTGTPAQAAGNVCTICRCSGFAPDPTDETVCIAFSTMLMTRCGHSYLNHP
jgi:hypothetical protein